MFSLQLAWNPIVVFNGLASVREVLVNHSEDTADRPPVPINEHMGFGPRSQGKGDGAWEAVVKGKIGRVYSGSDVIKGHKEKPTHSWDEA